MMLVYIGPYFNPNEAWIFTLLGLGYPYMLIINLLFILIWLAFRKKYIWISALTLLIGTAHVDRFYGFSGTGIEVETSDISILSLNTQGLQKVDLEGKDFLSFIEEANNSDIVLLQECYPGVTKKVKSHLAKHKIFQPTGVNLSIFSKTDIIQSGLVNKENASNGSIWADTKINGQDIRIYNAHLHSYKVTETAGDIIDSPDLANEKTWSNIRTIAGKIRDKSKLRANQVTEISNHIEGTSKQILLGGDFNDTPVSNTYRRLAKNLTDSFCAAGKGVGTTYAGKIPLLRIDYIFADASFTVVDHEVIDSSISDHYPIKSVIRLHR